MRRIREIIIHCSATPSGRAVSVAEIRRWHKARGFADIGYHYVIHLDGTVETGRDVGQIGAHCRGHNAHSIGVCYIGGLSEQGAQPQDTRTDAQKRAMEELCRDLLSRFPGAELHGHNEFAAKACPCFDVAKWARELAIIR